MTSFKLLLSNPFCLHFFLFAFAGSIRRWEKVPDWNDIQSWCWSQSTGGDNPFSALYWTQIQLCFCILVEPPEFTNRMYVDPGQNQRKFFLAPGAHPADNGTRETTGSWVMPDDGQVWENGAAICHASGGFPPCCPSTGLGLLLKRCWNAWKVG